MGTSNFHSVNASNVFAVDTSDLEFFDYEDDLDYIYQTLHDADSEWTPLLHIDNVKRSSQELRSYYRKYIAERSIYFVYAGVEINLTFRVFATNGYYSGYCLDWEVVADTNTGNNGCDNVGNNYNDDYSIADYIEKQCEEALYYDDTNKGLLAVHGDTLVNKVDNAIDNQIEVVEKLFKSYSTPLDVVAQFSNGETVYEQA